MIEARARSGPRGLTAAANRYAVNVKWISAALIVASLLLIGRQVPLNMVIRVLEDRVGRLGVWGPVVFGLIYALAAVVPVPVWPLTVTAGALFGPVVGSVTASLALTAGASLAFLVARYAARDAIVLRLHRHPKFDAIDRAIGQDGWKIVATIRLSPILPFSLQNYLYGVTRIRFRPYVLASWAAMLPGTMLYVYLGYAGRAGLEAAARPEGARTTAEWAAVGFGLLATVAATVYLTRLAHRAMEEEAHIAEAEVVELDELVLAEPVPARPEGWPWSATIAATLAIIMTGAAVFAQFHPDLIRSLMARRVSLPEVVTPDGAAVGSDRSAGEWLGTDPAENLHARGRDALRRHLRGRDARPGGGRSQVMGRLPNVNGSRGIEGTDEAEMAALAVDPLTPRPVARLRRPRRAAVADAPLRAAVGGDRAA